MGPRICWIVAFFALCAGPMPARADQEAGNVAHVAAGPFGQCYAKSIPDHVHDPDDQPRQQGTTRLFRVTAGADALIHEYPWFSQRLFVLCAPSDDITVIRLGPWHRGHDPRADHLAIAFYRGGALIRSYSTLEISGNKKADGAGFSRYANVSASVSHYTVFSHGPELFRETLADGAIFRDRWVVEAETIDGRRLRFDVETGELF